jgi:hypothetical protein
VRGDVERYDRFETNRPTCPISTCCAFLHLCHNQDVFSS